MLPEKPIEFPIFSELAFKPLTFESLGFFLFFFYLSCVLEMSERSLAIKNFAKTLVEDQMKSSFKEKEFKYLVFVLMFFLI